MELNQKKQKNKKGKAMIQKYIILILFMLLLPVVYAIGQKVPQNKWFLIQSAQEYEISNKGYWDIPGKPQTIGAGQKFDLNVWEKGGEIDRQFSFMNRGGDSYDIAAGIGMNTHAIKMEATFKKNGVKLQLEEKKGNGNDEIFNRQLFTIKYVGAGRWKIYSDDGRVMCLDGKSSKNGKNVNLWEDQDGAFTEWVFIDANTNKVVYPTFPENLSSISHGGKITNPEILKTINNMDQTYMSLYKSEKMVFQEMLAINKSNLTMRKSKSIVEDFDDLNNGVGTIGSVIGYLAKVPYVKVVALPISTTVDKLASGLEKANGQVTKLGSSVVFPSHDFFSKVKGTVDNHEAEFAYAMNVLIKMKDVYIKAAIAASSVPDATNKIVAQTATINNSLSKMRGVANIIAPDFALVRGINNDIVLVASTVNSLSSVLHQIAGSLSAVKDASNAIDDIMKEEFAGVSLKDIFNGAKIPGVDDIIDKAVGEIAKKLDIKFPSVPGVDEYKEKMATLKTSIEKVKNSHKKLEEHLANLHSATASLRQPFFMSLVSVPLEQMQQANLVEYSVK